MRRPTIRLLTLVITTTMLVGAATVAPAEARVHNKKHKIRPAVFGRSASPDQAWHGRSFNQPGSVCPGSGRSFECKIWPPPMDEDPDRKASGTDGG
jgi:hypothetical protein